MILKRLSSYIQLNASSEVWSSLITFADCCKTLTEHIKGGEVFIINYRFQSGPRFTLLLRIQV